MSSGTYKLTYFNAKARAELIRLIFAAADKQDLYIDNRIGFEEWQELKPKTPMGFLPMLECGDRVLSQSTTIARFAAAECGMYGNGTKWEIAEIDEIIETSAEFLDKSLSTVFGNDMAKEEARQKLNDSFAPNFLKVMEEKLAKTKGYFVGDMLTAADLAVFNALEIYLKQNPDGLNGYDRISQHRTDISQVGTVKKWLEQRPNTQF